MDGRLLHGRGHGQEAQAQEVNAKYFWLDLETLGLDPDTDPIIEYAFQITDKDLNTLATGGSIVQCPYLESALQQTDAFVIHMHTKNGLLAALREGAGDTGHNAYQIICDTVMAYTWDLGKPVFAGSTVHFDRTFLACQWSMPVEKLFHHRHYDVSSLKLERCDTLGREFAKGNAHRAMDDIVESLAQAREMRKDLT